MSRSSRVVSQLRLLVGRLGVGSALAVASVSYAQSEKSPPPSPQHDEAALEEIIVTAERRSSDAQKTATAVSVRSGGDLLQQGKTSVRQILEDIPAVVVTDNTGMYAAGSDTAGNNITIRGIKSNSGAATALPAVPTTAVYTDGVYEGIGGSYDLDRVEVLRGPQGTLYGRSATSGVVASHTKNPSFDRFSVDGTAEFGSYALQHYTGVVNVPLGDSFALRVAADQFSRDGYDSAAGGALERNSGRMKLSYRPSDDLAVLFGASVEKNHTHTGGVQGNMSGPDTVDYTSVPVRGGENVFEQYWLNIDWNLGPATLTYLPALRRWDQDAVIYAVGPGGMGMNQPIKTPFDQFVTHELRLASDETGPVKWLLGGFYYDNRLRNSTGTRWISSGAQLNSVDSRKETSNTGFFGEMTYAFLDAWRLTGGVRYDYTHVQTTEDYTTNLNYACNTPIGGASPDCPAAAPDSPDAGSPENNLTLSLTGDEGARRFYNTTYKVRLERDLTPANLLYTMVSTGFIPGDVQVTTGAGNVPVASEYGAEKLTAYEVGSKNRFLDDRLQVNGALFYYDYGGFQISVTADPTNPGSTFTTTVPAKVRGAELETLYQLTPRDRLSLSYSYTDAYFSDPQATFTQYVAEKHDVPGSVPHMVNAAYSHSFALPGGSTLDFRADARFQSAYNLGNVSAQLGDQGGLAYVHVGDEWISNLNGSWRSSSGKYSVTAYLRNVTDNRYKTYVQLQTLEPVPVASVAQYDPRTVGIVLSALY